MPCYCCSAVDIRGRCLPNRVGKINQDNWNACPMKNDTTILLLESTPTAKLWREYNELFKEYQQFNNDTEYAHIIQDKIYKKFVNDIVDGRFENQSEYLAMSLLIKYNIVIYDTPGRWWYA